jgi:hypothetical protein
VVAVFRDIGTGPEDIFGLVTFRIDMNHPGHLQPLGSRAFTTADGHLCAICFEKERGDLLLFWAGHREHGLYLMRGSVDELVNRKEQRLHLPENVTIPIRAEACASRPFCFLQAQNGQISVLDLRIAQVVSILPASLGAESLELGSTDHFEVMCADDFGRVFVARTHGLERDTGGQLP